MYIEEKRSSAFGLSLALFDYVFLDTCSLMEEEFPEFMERLWNSKDYWKISTHIVLLSAVNAELEEKVNDPNPVKRIGAIRALKILKQDAGMGGTKLLEHEKKTKDTFADNSITNMVNRYRLDKKVLVITQDRKLARDLLKLNEMESQHGIPVQVFTIKEEGFISPIKDALEQTASQKQPNLSAHHLPQGKKKETQKEETVRNKALDKTGKGGKEQGKNPLPEVLRGRGKEKPLSRNPLPKPLKAGDTLVAVPALNFLTAPTLEEALRKAASDANILIRADSVEYIPLVHGPYNIKESDLNKALSSFTIIPGERKELSLQKATFVVEKRRDYRVAFKKEEKKDPPKKAKETSPSKVQTKKGKEESPALKEALRYEKILMANLSNSLVTKERKLQDIQEQSARLRALKPSERSKCKYGLHMLQVESKKLR